MSLTNAQLIEALKLLPPDQLARISIRQYNKRYEVADLGVSSCDHFYGGTMHASFGEGWSVQYRGPRDERGEPIGPARGLTRCKGCTAYCSFRCLRKGDA